MTNDDHRAAKADAKAAKAHAKALRPWWKKKRIIFPLGLVLLILVGVGASGGGDDKGPSGGGTTEQTEEASTSGSVGEPIENAGTTYEVTAVDTKQVLGDPDLGGARADGVFVVVDLSLTNTKDETKTFSEASAKLETADGKAYKTSDKTILAFGDEGLMLKDIQPDLTTKGKLAFDIPPSKAAGSKLVVEDIWGDGEVTVDLGL